jgi:hypothetical protein
VEGQRSPQLEMEPIPLQAEEDRREHPTQENIHRKVSTSASEE